MSHGGSGATHEICKHCGKAIELWREIYRYNRGVTRWMHVWEDGPDSEARSAAHAYQECRDLDGEVAEPVWDPTDREISEAVIRINQEDSGAR